MINLRLCVWHLNISLVDYDNNMATWGPTGQKHHCLSMSYLGYKEQKSLRYLNFGQQTAINDVIIQNGCQNVSHTDPEYK